ncbi:VOC family protein [Kibdelosporangium aridum]|uniref:Glyoxalase-like domain-containing protein n=1 Tax=Kibdelosporangium aridum TaxID=2030 RepID=A0A1W2FPM7_KIBAR|nr:VOC family protein [Kibdelosporangium aridum]SMD23885.1 Glyoxalase-like domain-containing protein [Kibdelosporangium aridum]
MALDHLVYAVPDLALAGDLGIDLSEGGRHIGRGTRNLLADLGDGAYLEVIGPDPDQPEPDQPRPFGIDTLTEPKLVAWAVRVKDIEDVVERAKAQGYDPGPVVPMSRERPDGVLLQWQLTPMLPGLLPFLIDWGSTRHPSEDAAQGAQLELFQISDPNPDDVYKGLKALGLDYPVANGPTGLQATIRTPNGEVVLR